MDNQLNGDGLTASDVKQKSRCTCRRQVDAAQTRRGERRCVNVCSVPNDSGVAGRSKVGIVVQVSRKRCAVGFERDTSKCRSDSYIAFIAD